MLQSSKTFQLLFFILLIIFSCKKPENRSCLKSSGEIKSEIRHLGAFLRIRLFENLNYELIKDSVEYVELIGGKNLLNFIQTEVKNEVLTIQDQNTCSFLRSLKTKVLVRIHFRELDNIYYQGSENLRTLDTLQTKYMTYAQKSGGGTANLIFNVKYLLVFHSGGVGNFNFSGKCDALNIELEGNGYCDVRGLVVRDSIAFTHNSFGDMKLSADTIPLRGVIKNSGNVYCKGIPSLVNVSELFTGKLVYLP
jgi:hypothetical protein